MRFGWRCAVKSVGTVAAAGVLVAAALGTLVKTIVESEDGWEEL